MKRGEGGCHRFQVAPGDTHDYTTADIQQRVIDSVAISWGWKKQEEYTGKKHKKSRDKIYFPYLNKLFLDLRAQRILREGRTRVRLLYALQDGPVPEKLVDKHSLYERRTQLVQAYDTRVERRKKSCSRGGRRGESKLLSVHPAENK